MTARIILAVVLLWAAAPKSCGQTTAASGGTGVSSGSTSSGSSSQSVISYTVAKTDTATYSGAAPALGAAGTFITDPDFGMRVLRVTQNKSCDTRSGGTGFGTSGGGWQPLWSKDDSKILFSGGDQGFWYYQGIDPVNFTITGPCKNVIPTKLGGFVAFSATNASRIYGLDRDGKHLSYLDTSTSRVTQVFDLTTVPGFKVTSLYLIAMDSNDAWVCSSNNSQDLGRQIGCYNIQTGATQSLDFGTATEKQGAGAPVALDNLSAAQLAGCGIHTLIMGGGGDWIHTEMNGCSAWPIATGAAEMFWQLGTNHVTVKPQPTGGHQAMGWNGAFLEQPGQSSIWCSTDQGNGTVLWFANNLGTTAANYANSKFVQVFPCFSGPTATGFGNRNGHMTWLNNVNDSNANRYPVLGMEDPESALGCNGFPYLCGEIFAIQMGPAVDKWNVGQYRAAVSKVTIWRFAHTYNDPSNSQCDAMKWLSPNVSRDGRYAMFPSDWLGATGTGSCTKHRRLDLFIVELK